jgi:hypothetical protein
MISLPLGMTGNLAANQSPVALSYVYIISPSKAMATGFVLRIIYANPPFTLGKYIAMDLVCPSLVYVKF